MAIQDREPPKLVHKLVFSMPAGTPAVGLLAATRDFLREEFGGKHRYAFVLHEDRPQPHVHVVVRARSRHGERLNIRKETLRHWRQGFARHLGEHGIAANATERAVRGQARAPKSDRIYRTQLRGDSTHMRERAHAVASELAKGKLVVEPGQAQLLRTRREVTDGWRAVANMLRSDGQHELASKVDQFIGRMPPPLTDKQWIASKLMEHARARHGPEHERSYSR